MPSEIKEIYELRVELSSTSDNIAARQELNDGGTTMYWYIYQFSSAMYF